LILTPKRCDYSISVEYLPLSISRHKCLPLKEGYEIRHTSGSKRSKGATSQAEEGLYSPTLHGKSIIALKTEMNKEEFETGARYL